MTAVAAILLGSSCTPIWRLRSKSAFALGLANSNPPSSASARTFRRLIAVCMKTDFPAVGPAITGMCTVGAVRLFVGSIA
jgi:hypothetical protein